MAAASTCAHALTEAGRVPFTRGDLVEYVQQRAPMARPGSINPVIQGITGNLKGGVQGAAGKAVLHSDGRGKFVLRNDSGAEDSGTGRSRHESSVSGSRAESAPRASRTIPHKEEELRDELLELLRPRLRDTGYVAEAEGTTTYRVPDGTVLRHASDILISKPGSVKQVSVEVKYKSAVTDQFKSRAYDAAHMKEQHGQNILTIMVFARANVGISIERARSICHPFDRFYADDASRFLTADGLDEVVADIRAFLQ